MQGEELLGSQRSPMLLVGGHTLDNCKYKAIL